MNRFSKHPLRGVLGILVVPWVLCPFVAGAQTAEMMTLRESIDHALKQSVVLHAAKEGVRGAEAQRKEAFTGFLPKFSTSYSYTRLNEEPYFVFPGAPPFIPAGTMITGTKDNYNWAIEARQPLFAGGGILSNYEANRLGADIARQEVTATAQGLVQEVKIAYFNILKSRRILEVANHSVEQLEAHRNTAQGFYDNGIIPRNDLLHAEVELANGRQFLVRAQNALEMAQAKFNTLLRREIGAAVEIEDVLSETPYVESLERCIAMALEKRPELRSSSLRVAQAKSLVKFSESEYYPNVNLVGNYARFGDIMGVSGTGYRHQESWYAMVVASWNFWEWGKTKNRVETSLSRESQAADLLVNMKDQIILEVKNAYLLLHEAQRQVRVSKKAIEQAEENFRINTERYREQVGTSTDVLDAQTLLTRARSDHANALSDYSIHQARLQKAMGEDDRGEERP